MSGNKIGGEKAGKTNKQKTSVIIDGKTIQIEPGTFYAVVGGVGGKKGKTGGFASDVVGKDGLTGRQRASKVGVLGGKKSRRG